MSEQVSKNESELEMRKLHTILLSFEFPNPLTHSHFALQEFRKHFASVIRSHSRCICATSSKGPLPSSNCAECREFVEHMRPAVVNPQKIPDGLFHLIKELLDEENGFLKEKPVKWGESTIILFLFHKSELLIFARVE